MAQNKLLELLGLPDPDSKLAFSAEEIKALKRGIDELKRENAELRAITKEGSETKKEGNTEDFLGGLFK